MAITRIGLLGLGRLGRQIYELALEDARFEVAALAATGQPEVLHHLLQNSLTLPRDLTLDANYLVCGGMRTRLITAEHTREIPWDALGVDLVIDAAGHLGSVRQARAFVENGARRVLLSALPKAEISAEPGGEIDRVLICGVNEAQAQRSDAVISAGSGSTTATVLALKTVQDAFEIEHASMTSVHAYTSDQRLQDEIGQDYRRSRSGANNIIPNDTPALDWVQRCLPAMHGRLTGYALNVPVQTGSMLDLDISLKEPIADVGAIKELFIAAEAQLPRLIETTNEPVVSSDVKGCTRSLLVDLRGVTCSGSRLLKVLGWHETLGHAHRLLDVAALYQKLPTTGAVATAENSA